MPLGPNQLRGAIIAALLALPLGLAACGDDEGREPEPLDLEDWQARVSQLCSDGIQEATALPLPTTGAEVGPDARAMAEVVLTARDGILILATPEGQEEAVAVYLSELSGDAELLLRVARKAERGEDYQTPLARLDESAGQAALELALQDCAAFANAVARTP